MEEVRAALAAKAIPFRELFILLAAFSIIYLSPFIKKKPLPKREPLPKDPAEWPAALRSFLTVTRGRSFMELTTEELIAATPGESALHQLSLSLDQMLYRPEAPSQEEIQQLKNEITLLIDSK